jgi:hypothetical protein
LGSAGGGADLSLREARLVVGVGAGSGGKETVLGVTNVPCQWRGSAATRETWSAGEGLDSLGRSYSYRM